MPSRSRVQLIRWCSAIAVAATLLAGPAQAAVFNPHYLLSDQELRDADAMTLADIQRFLDSRGGLGKTFDTDPGDGLLKGSAQLVYDAAQRYRVNPKYLLVLIQKESSAVESSSPTPKQLDWATGYALCDDCLRNSPLAIKYRGLAKQIDAGAGWIDWYFTNAMVKRFAVAPNVTASLDKFQVTPGNLATAALYNYTPHVSGNRLVWSIWNRWFGDGMLGVDFPDGTLVRNTKDGAVALIQGGKFRPLANKSVLDTRFAGRPLVDLNEYDFSALQRAGAGPAVRFADLSLVRVTDGTVYLLVGDKKRRIVSPEAFRAIGFNPEEVEDAVLADIADYADGEPIEAAESAPAGRLVQDPRTGGVYSVDAGMKHPILDRVVLAVNFPGRPIERGTVAELNALPTGAPVPLADGILVKSKDDPTVYAITDGEKRPIPTEAVFYAFGYKWTDVRVVPAKLLALHTTGIPLGFSAEESGLPAGAVASVQ
jgi:hypothetical protein